MALPPTLAHLRSLLDQGGVEPLLAPVDSRLREELDILNVNLTPDAVSGLLRHGHRTEPAGGACPCCGRPFSVTGSGESSE